MSVKTHKRWQNSNPKWVTSDSKAIMKQDTTATEGLSAVLALALWSPIAAALFIWGGIKLWAVVCDIFVPGPTPPEFWIDALYSIFYGVMMAICAMWLRVVPLESIRTLLKR